jgi:hypothetical protein
MKAEKTNPADRNLATSSSDRPTAEQSQLIQSQLAPWSYDEGQCSGQSLQGLTMQKALDLPMVSGSSMGQGTPSATGHWTYDAGQCRATGSSSGGPPNPSQRVQYGPNGELLTPRGGWLRDSDYRTFTFDEEGDIDMDKDKKPDHSSFLQARMTLTKRPDAARTSAQLGVFTLVTMAVSACASKTPAMGTRATDWEEKPRALNRGASAWNFAPLSPQAAVQTKANRLHGHAIADAPNRTAYLPAVHKWLR